MNAERPKAFISYFGFEPRRLRFCFFIGKTTPNRHSTTRFHDSFMTNQMQPRPAAQDRSGRAFGWPL